ncbi:molybdopterin molybdotransferase MoeA [Streptomyces marincola]|uniref:molybdopterin molybdotransferase MoeA n=1 Tax=Streptomyces marincola TaxID=2878388 RepID=UPI001CF39221|nr:molybdopterin molybdotransferase MoeA [Streptomyces marincola]UCM89036.1 molybdopterin molybdotransferase MoeA [Streptomyces marincola]
MTDEFDDALALANGPAAAAARGAGRRGVARPRTAASPTPAPADPLAAVQDEAPAGQVRPAWESARATAYRAVRPLPPRRLPLDLALGHTLAAPLAALTDLPAFDTSAMDGWAVAGPGPWRLTAEGPGLLAGSPGTAPLTDGEAVPIATGARVPEGATAVLRAERGDVAHGRLHGASPQPGSDIRPRGQECRSGTELLPARATLTPAALGLAAAAGYDQLAVRPRPRAEVLVLGDELLFRGLPHDGRIRDALGPMTGPWLTALGAQVMVTRRLGDDAEALHEAMSTSRADVIVTTGSTAAGPMDHLRAVLSRLGAHLLVSGVAVRPGHPMLLAELPGGTPLVGLPGNPLAAVSGLLTLAEPLLRALADRPSAPQRHARLADDVRGHPEDTRLVPVELPEPGVAMPLAYAGPAMLRGIAAAAALAVIPPGGARAGDRARLLDLPAT